MKSFFKNLFKSSLAQAGVFLIVLFVLFACGGSSSSNSVSTVYVPGTKVETLDPDISKKIDEAFSDVSSSSTIVEGLRSSAKTLASFEEAIVEMSDEQFTQIDTKAEASIILDDPKYKAASDEFYSYIHQLDQSKYERAIFEYNTNTYFGKVGQERLQILNHLSAWGK